MTTPRTVETPFYRYPDLFENPEPGTLFAVRPGVPMDAALECASNILASALGSATLAAHDYHGERSDALWSAVYLLEMAKALLDGTISGVLAASASTLELSGISS